MPTPKPLRELPPIGQTLIVLLTAAASAFALLIQTERWIWAAVGCVLPACTVKALCRRPARAARKPRRNAAEMDRMTARLIASLEDSTNARRGLANGGGRCAPVAAVGRVSPAPYNLGAALRSPIDARSAVDALAREAIRVAPGVTATVSLLGDDGRFCVASAIGLYSDRLLDIVLPSAPETWQQALRTGKPVVNVSPDAYVAGAIPTPGSADLRCALVAPLTHEGRSLGVVCVYHTRRNAFAPRDAERLSLVTEIIAESLGSSVPITAPIFKPETLPENPAVGEITQRLNARLERSVSSRAPFAVLLVHLDRLEPDCKPLSLLADDPLLAEAAAVVRGCLRPGDALEFKVDSGFAVIVEGATLDTPVRVCSRITTAIERMAVHLGVNLAASAGYGVFPEDGRASHDLLGTANRRLRMDRGARLLG